MEQDHEAGAGRTNPDCAPPGAAPAAAPTRPPLDAAARARIGRGLRLHYAAVLALPIPDRLLALLDDLAARADREVPR